MTQRIEMAAILRRGDRLLLLQPAASSAWELPGADFAESDDDIDEAMRRCLERFGIAAAAIEEDFLETVFLGQPEDRLIYNVYAPATWMGEPAPPPGSRLNWFELHELERLEIRAEVREAVLEVLGLQQRRDSTAEIARELQRAMGGNVATGQPAPPTGLATGHDVLLSLNGGDAEAEARLRARMPELAGDVIHALGETWARPAINRKTRSLQVVAMLAALGRTGPLRAHISGALNHGATPEEIIETVRMVAVYAGFPAAIEAWPVMEEVFAAHGVSRDRRRP